MSRLADGEITEDRQTFGGRVESSTARKWEETIGGAETSMFDEDVRLLVLPYGLRKHIEVVLEGEEEARTLVARALTGERAIRRSLEEAVIHFVRECSQGLITFGQMQYEIVKERKGADGRFVGFRLSGVPPYSVRWRWFRWVQDRSVTTVGRRGRGRVAPVDISRIVTFNLPLALSRRRLLRIRRQLRNIGEELVPAFGFDPATQPAGYDFKTFLRYRERALAAATAELGWNARATFSEYTTEYYYLVREIRFQRFLIEVREAVLARLNEVLASVLPQLGVQGRLTVRGLLSMADLDRLQAEADAGGDTRAIGRRLYRRG